MSPLRCLSDPDRMARWTDLVFVRVDVESVEEAAIQRRAREARIWSLVALALIFGTLMGDGYVTQERALAALSLPMVTP